MDYTRHSLIPLAEIERAIAATEASLKAAKAALSAGDLTAADRAMHRAKELYSAAMETAPRLRRTA